MNRLDLGYIRRFVTEDNGCLLGNCAGLVFHSAFQPIFSLAHKRMVGYEALSRVFDPAHHQVDPLHLFNADRPRSETVFMDRLARFLHLNNFRHLHDPINWLFLNVSPQTIVHGRDYGPFFGALLDCCGFPSHRTVIEIVEHPILSNDHLMEVVGYYKTLGCLIAIDDFGAGHSNFDRIWVLKPDIVKLDRSILLRSCEEKRIRQLLPGMVSLLHQAGSLVLLEGVETEQQAMIAMESDADLVQGYFFASPTLAPDRPVIRPPSGKLFARYKHNFLAEEQRTKERYRCFDEFFLACAHDINQGRPLEESCRALLAHPAVIRCYLLNPDGIQIGHTVVSPLCFHHTDKRFLPLEDAKDADWFRRYYLKRAILEPDRLQISRPYLSIAGAHMCITLSMMFSSPDGSKVLCCDLIDALEETKTPGP